MEMLVSSAEASIMGAQEPLASKGIFSDKALATPLPSQIRKFGLNMEAVNKPNKYYYLLKNQPLIYHMSTQQICKPVDAIGKW